MLRHQLKSKKQTDVDGLAAELRIGKLPKRRGEARKETSILRIKSGGQTHV